MGCSNEHAVLRRCLILSDLRALTHTGRAPGRLRGLWRKKRINAKPEITIVYETPTTRL